MTTPARSPRSTTRSWTRRPSRRQHAPDPVPARCRRRPARRTRPGCFPRRVRADRWARAQSFGIPAFGVVPPPYSQLFTFISPGATGAGIPATLTIDIIGSLGDFVIPSGPNAGNRFDSFTYTFNVAQPVPEPASIILLATALAGITAQLGRRRGKTA